MFRKVFANSYFLILEQRVKIAHHLHYPHLSREQSSAAIPPRAVRWVVSFQDFLIELDMKPCMRLLETSSFLLNNVTIRLTKIMNNLLKDLKILIFKVNFQCGKLIESFQKKILWRILD